MLAPISQSTPNAIADLEQAVVRGATDSAGRRLYALLDLAPHEGLLQRLTSIEGGLLWKSLFDGTPEEALLEAAPILIELPLRPNKALSRELVKAERASPSVSWLRTGLTFRDLFLHVQPFLDADMPNGSKALFRFYDPRTLTSIRSGLGSDKLGKSLFEPISEWWLWQSGSYRNLLEGFRHA